MVIDEGDSVPLSVGTVVVQMIYVHIRPRWHTQHEHSSVSSYCIFTTSLCITAKIWRGWRHKTITFSFQCRTPERITASDLCSVWAQLSPHTCMSPSWLSPCNHATKWNLLWRYNGLFLLDKAAWGHGCAEICWLYWLTVTKCKKKTLTDTSTKKNTSQTHGVQLKIDLFSNQK